MESSPPVESWNHRQSLRSPRLSPESTKCNIRPLSCWASSSSSASRLFSMPSQRMDRYSRAWSNQGALQKQFWRLQKVYSWLTLQWEVHLFRSYWGMPSLQPNSSPSQTCWSTWASSKYLWMGPAEIKHWLGRWSWGHLSQIHIREPHQCQLVNPLVTPKVNWVLIKDFIVP